MNNPEITQLTAEKIESFKTAEPDFPWQVVLALVVDILTNYQKTIAVRPDEAQILLINSQQTLPETTTIAAVTDKVNMVLAEAKRELLGK